MTKIETLVKLIDQSSINCHGVYCRECPFNGPDNGTVSGALLHLNDANAEGIAIKKAIIAAVDEAREEEGIPKKGEEWKRIGSDDCTAVTILNVGGCLKDRPEVKFSSGHVAITVSLESFLKAYEKVEEPEKKHSHTTPDHYRLNPEPIDVIRGWNLGFCLGNVIKYIARAGHKAGESRDKDLHKAMEYLRMELDHERK